MKPVGHGRSERAKSPWGDRQRGGEDAFEFEQRFFVVDDGVERTSSERKTKGGGGAVETTGRV